MPKIKKLIILFLSIAVVLTTFGCSNDPLNSSPDVIISDAETAPDTSKNITSDNSVVNSEISVTSDLSFIEDISEFISSLDSSINSSNTSIIDESETIMSKDESIPGVSSSTDESIPDVSSSTDVSIPDVSSGTDESVTEPIPDNKPLYKGVRVAYIPLDSRPVNVDRVKYLAESVGITLLMPNEDLYATKLDGQPVNSNGTQYGNREELLKWIKAVDKECDYYIISLDQLLSGGLVSSRDLDNTDLSLEYRIINELAELSKNNKIYLFDTVMRLASTVGYKGYEMNEYSALRAYGAVARPVLNASELTVENIVNSYKLNTDNSIVTSTLSASKIEKYLNARQRKLKIIHAILSHSELSYGYLYVGVDDSSPKNTIQTNEIQYIKNNSGDNFTLFAGTDELGMLALTKLCTDLAGKQFSALVSYYGGNEDNAADSYDIGTLRENINAHITSVNGIITNVPSRAELHILVLTAPSNANEKSAYVNSLAERINTNINNKIPTIVIDVSSGAYNYLLQDKIVNNVEMSMLLGYSNWNTAGNSIGIAISQGVSRYFYLKYETEKSIAADTGFLKSVAFGYIKDISYKTSGSNIVNQYINSSVGSASNFYSASLDFDNVKNRLTEIMLGSDYSRNVNTVMQSFNKGYYISDLSTYQVIKTPNLTAEDFTFPWYRTFEITFQIKITA